VSGLEPPDEIVNIRTLTPGDFSIVCRKAEIMGSRGNLKTLVEMLRAECEAKSGRPQRMGFSVQER